MTVHILLYNKITLCRMFYRSYDKSGLGQPQQLNLTNECIRKQTTPVLSVIICYAYARSIDIYRLFDLCNNIYPPILRYNVSLTKVLSITLIPIIITMIALLAMITLVMVNIIVYMYWGWVYGADGHREWCFIYLSQHVLFFKNLLW